MKSRLLKALLILFFLLLIICLLYFFRQGQVLSPEKNAQLKPVFIGQSQILAEIADTPAERELGLGKRSDLKENHGMIFVFDQPARYGFWMKDTNFPLDFIWIDENKKIIDITEDVQPASYPKVFYPAEPAFYVLEVGDGYAKKQGIKVGDSVSF